MRLSQISPSRYEGTTQLVDVWVGGTPYELSAEDNDTLIEQALTPERLADRRKGIMLCRVCGTVATSFRREAISYEVEADHPEAMYKHFKPGALICGCAEHPA